MTESKFIELLNLYVDHQISPTEAALLEAEIQRDPARRKIYRQYCQMQKACALLADSFRTEAPAPTRAEELAPARRGFAPFGYAAGALAAAACVALVVVLRGPTVAPSGAASPSVASTMAKPAALDSGALTAAPLPARVALQPAFAGFESPKAEAKLQLAGSQVRLDWMDRVQLRRVTTEEIWFKPQPVSQPDDLLFRSPRTFQGQVEMTAWRFQK